MYQVDTGIVKDSQRNTEDPDSPSISLLHPDVQRQQIDALTKQLAVRGVEVARLQDAVETQHWQIAHWKHEVGTMERRCVAYRSEIDDLRRRLIRAGVRAYD